MARISPAAHAYLQAATNSLIIVWYLGLGSKPSVNDRGAGAAFTLYQKKPIFLDETAGEL
jgi:hypothetical protein